MAALPDLFGWKEGNEEDVSIIPKCFCPCCENSNATTTMLPTKVPMFREIILMNLICDDCGFRNAEVNFGGEIQERGCKLTLTVQSPDDLNRQVIKADSCTVRIPQLDLEIPTHTQRGNISTLEGMLRTAANNLEQLQPERLRLGDIDNFHRCRHAIAELRHFACERNDNDGDADDENEADTGENAPPFPFEVILDDPAGNSFIENLHAPHPDPHLVAETYWRTATQDMSLGLQPSEQAKQAGAIDDTNAEHKNVANAGPGQHAVDTTSMPPPQNLGREEVLKFPSNCPSCHKGSETDMCVTDIPHFKEVIIMSLCCEHCGYGCNEIKGGGAIPKFGTKISVSIGCHDDLAREVLKSDTAGIAIPEVDLELEEGGLDGVYTTVEGLLGKIRDRLERANPFGSGDAVKKHHISNDGGEFSGPSPTYVRYMAFLRKLQDMADGKIFPFTLVISDPLSNSFVGPIPADAIALSLQAEKDGHNQCYNAYDDAGMEVEEYERTFEQNEVLGLNDMKTENYQAHLDGKEEQYYGTDTMEELPDRLRRLDVRGPDHPHQVGKAPVEGDTTVMGVGSANFAVPGMSKRGKPTERAPAMPVDAAALATALEQREIRKVVHKSEYHDNTFVMSDEYTGPRAGMIFKDGAQGIGYYKDVPLMEMWSQNDH